MTLASMLFWSQVVTRILASEVSTRKSGLPVRLYVLVHSSARADRVLIKQSTNTATETRVNVDFIRILRPGKHTFVRPVRVVYAPGVRLVPAKFAIGPRRLRSPGRPSGVTRVLHFQR